MATSFSVGWLARDGKTGKWSYKKSNRKKAPVEFEGRTKAQRVKDRKARQKRSEELGKARTERAEARRKDREKARFEKARQQQAFRDRAQTRAEEDPGPTVTVTGVWGHGPAKGPAGTRVVKGEVVGSRTRKAIGPAQKCGQKTADGTPCLRLGTCPAGTHRTKAATRKTGDKAGAGSR